MRLWRSQTISEVDTLVYASTANQIDSLAATIAALDRLGMRVQPVSDNSKLLRRHPRYHRLTYPLSVVLATLYFRIKRRRLCGRLLREHHAKRIDALDLYKVIHALFVANSTIEGSHPNTLILANDHNLAHRCFIAIGHLRGARTAYLQHASVSDRFPRLNFDIAFLDGRISANAYTACADNYPRGRPARSFLKRKPTVFLSGQKKGMLKHNMGGGQEVGIAMSAKDNLSTVFALMTFLIRNNHQIRARWHPGQSRLDRDALLSFADQHQPHISISDPAKESQAFFFRNCFCVIAGNCSILLESAICGIPPLQYALNESQPPDYYGFIEAGLARACPSLPLLLENVQSARCGGLTPSIKSVRVFSETFKTPWEGREGELVAETLVRLKESRSVCDLYRHLPDFGDMLFSKVYGLRSEQTTITTHA